MRKISTRLYVTAFVITLLVFSLGVLLGMVVEGKRLSYIEEQDRIQKVNFNSLQLQYLYLSGIEEKTNCPAFSVTLNKYVKEADEAREKLEYYTEKSSAYTDEFKLVKREYVVSQLNYWMLARKTKAMCGSDFVTVLYFYSRKCPTCDDQGFVLDYLKRVFKDRLLIFALDEDFTEEPMISVISATYNVSSTPTIVIEDNVFYKFQSKDQLLEAICSRFETKPGDCP